MSRSIVSSCDAVDDYTNKLVADIGAVVKAHRGTDGELLANVLSVAALDYFDNILKRG